MRAAFSEALLALAKSDPRVLLLTGDHGYALFDGFRRECPRQYINAGIAEQNMVGMAAGLAKAGFRPFVYGLSAFVPIRVLEQIKIDVAHDKLPVVFLGDGAGLVYSHLGTSHQSTEDIACTRAIPHLAIYSPADRFEMKLCMQMAYDARGPVYLRMGKSDRGDVHQAPLTQANAGQWLALKPGSAGGPAFVATGSMAVTALRLAREAFPQASVWSAPCIKPAPVEQIATLCRESSCVVTLEEHSVIGGLGSLVSETACAMAPARVLRIGVEDKFSEHCGTHAYLLKEHEIDDESIRRRLAALLQGV
ncbi:transketolase family protein [Herbaspirillum aquaticum]|jgi:transketolase|uniref:transketolase family protein n=1 Tax=Herbaspirillum aquaticum TaxID=568783 RepID=UPI0024DE405A|nr:transketolase C-terminal domain-containing protein [Herbaspirillum aquaticum]